MRRIIIGIACLVLATWAVITVLYARHPVPTGVAPACGRLAALITQPAQSVKVVKLGNSTRNAVEVMPGTSFEAEAGAAASYIDFSIGAADLSATSPELRFDISAPVAGQWQVVFSAALKPDTAGWVDERLDLRTLGAQTRHLRFTVNAAAPSSAVKTEKGYWGALVTLACPTTPDSRPNVILISLDTLGADHLSAFGNMRGVSPKIDEFLEQGFSFRRAYVQYPNTLVSHASMLTGRYPLHHGVYEESPMMPPVTLASLLADRGYVTAAITEDAFIGSDFGFDHGFDRYDNGDAGSEERALTGNAAETFAKATEWLDRWGYDTRFFLFVHTYEVHSPYAPRDAEAMRIADQIDPDYRGPFEKAYMGGMIEALNNSGWMVMGEKDCARLAALYAGEINYLDRIVGRFLEHMASLPMAGDTLVVLTADHGDEFGEHGKLGHGETLFNGVLHVPLAFYWPGHTVRGSYDLPAQSVDIVPTVLDVVGIKPPPIPDGVSRRGLILGQTRTQPTQPAFAELKAIPFVGQRAAQGGCVQFGLPADCHVDRRAVQTERFKLISSKFPPYENLYDLQNDPHEAHDVAAQYPQEMERLRNMLVAYESGEPVAAAPAASAAPAIDAATRERLRALGYLK